MCVESQNMEPEGPGKQSNIVLSALHKVFNLIFKTTL